MQELGKESEKYHKEIFNLINNSDIEKCLFICDKKNEKIYTNYLKDKKKFLVLNNINDVPKEINKSTKKGDSVLIKGSRCWQLEKINELIKDINYEFSQSKNIIIIPISTLNKKDILFLKNKIRELILEINKNISTSQINKWLNHVVENNSHPRINGKEVKFKYGTQISKNPLTIKIFSNFSKEISISDFSNSNKHALLNINSWTSKGRQLS